MAVMWALGMGNVSQPRLLGLIAARGGSKGIPRKNIAPCGGLPLLAWTARAAHESGVIDRLILSTDDLDIAAVAQEHGVEVPFMRPGQLADDKAASIDVVLHSLQWLEQHDGYIPEFVIYLQPTSPLRQGSDIRAAWETMNSKKAASVIGVSSADQHPLWAKRIDEGGRLSSYLQGVEVPPTRQQLPPAYVVNGAIYLSCREALVKTGTFYGEPCYGEVMSPEASIDIDSPLDLEIADLLLRKRLKGGGDQYD